MLFSPIARLVWGVCLPRYEETSRAMGQTIEELQKYLDEPQGRILTVLVPLKAEAFVATSKSGVWTIVREACSVPPRSLQC
jgi:hypothetical protein